MLKRSRRQSGDTIVEVMVVLAILGLAIAICYSTASRSLSYTRSAQENAQATALVQQQVELARLWATRLNYATLPASFCLDGNATTAATVVSTSCNNYNGTIYNLAVDYTTSGTDPDLFHITATWPQVTGGGTSTVTMYYRVHQ